jgi:hypothetical protein
MTATATEEPIKYITKEKSLIGNEIHEAGALVVLPEGTLPAENLTPTCARGEAKYQEYLASNAKRVAAMNASFVPAAQGFDAAVFGALIQAAVREAINAYAKEQEELAKVRQEASRLEAVSVTGKNPKSVKEHADLA